MSWLGFGSKSKEAVQQSSSDEEELNEEQYLHRNLSCEQVDSDDLSGDLNLSDQEDNDRAHVKQVKQQKRLKRGAKAKAHTYNMEVDTNVFQISLSCLKENAELATGDPELCKSCKAVFNKDSKVVMVENQQVWNCEFCNQTNNVSLEDEEIPKSNIVNFLVEAAAQVEDKKLAG